MSATGSRPRAGAADAELRVPGPPPRAPGLRFPFPAESASPVSPFPVNFETPVTHNKNEGSRFRELATSINLSRREYDVRTGSMQLLFRVRGLASGLGSLTRRHSRAPLPRPRSSQWSGRNGSVASAAASSVRPSAGRRRSCASITDEYVPRAAACNRCGINGGRFRGLACARPGAVALQHAAEPQPVGLAIRRAIAQTIQSLKCPKQRPPRPRPHIGRARRLWPRDCEIGAVRMDFGHSSVGRVSACT